MKIAICDDEKPILKKIGVTLQSLYQAKTDDVFIYEFTKGIDLVNSHKSSKFDIIYLDIDMPELNGLDTAGLIRDSDDDVLLIFITNIEKYVYESFKVMPFRFVRKNHFEDLEEAVNSSAKRILQGNQKIKFETENGPLDINIGNIQAFTSIGHNIYLCTNKKNIRVFSTLQKLEKELDKYGFVRTHKSFLVNCKHMDYLKDNSVVMNNKTEIPISRRQLKNVQEKFLRYYSE